LAAVVACALGAVTAGSAFADTIGLPPATNPFVAFLGNPGATPPLGLGAAKDFGIGENMVFRGGTLSGVAETADVSITLEGVTDHCEDAIAGGTLVSNKTSTTANDTPIGFDIQSVDFQHCLIGTTPAPTFSDTKDHVWHARIKEAAGGTTIEDVAVDVGGKLLRGEVTGSWKQGTTGKPPCITLTGVGTLATDPGGVKPAAIAGKICLISSNNDGPNNVVLSNP
jgi:hypothetical protein